MSHDYHATIRWTRDAGALFTDGKYSRGHVWVFDGAEVQASSSPSVVPLPLSRADAVDPEEAFVASLSSCHMLFFLAFAARRRFVVDSYEDAALGTMGKNAAGKTVVSRVTLRPAIVFSGDRRPGAEELAELHHRAHEECFLANSVTTEIVVEAGPPIST